LASTKNRLKLFVSDYLVNWRPSLQKMMSAFCRSQPDTNKTTMCLFTSSFSLVHILPIP